MGGKYFTKTKTRLGLSNQGKIYKKLVAVKPRKEEKVKERQWEGLREGEAPPKTEPHPDKFYTRRKKEQGHIPLSEANTGGHCYPKTERREGGARPAQRGRRGGCEEGKGPQTVEPRFTKGTGAGRGQSQVVQRYTFGEGK